MGTSIAIKAKTLLEAGSSPRVWGQDELKNGEFSYMRIIPTRMGTSSPSVMMMWFMADHPHAYGDKYVITR